MGIQDEACLVAALLHDTLEDTNVDHGRIKGEFGKEVLEIVDGVTKLKGDTDKDTLSTLLSKSYLNPKIAIVKLADRLHNMRTLEFMSPEKQVAKSQETLDVYAKLAESLGMWEIYLCRHG